MKIKHRFELNPRTQSCVRCGVIKAIEALQTSGSTVGANLILLSQGHLSVISRDDEKYLLDLSAKHKLRLFNMPLIDNSHNNVSILFESLSFQTGGNSFLIQTQNDALNVYMEFMDSLREIQRRSEAYAPALIHEKEITQEALSIEANGEFVIDQHVGNQTEFQVYTLFIMLSVSALSCDWLLAARALSRPDREHRIRHFRKCRSKPLTL